MSSFGFLRRCRTLLCSKCTSTTHIHHHLHPPSHPSPITPTATGVHRTTSGSLTKPSPSLLTSSALNQPRRSVSSDANTFDMIFEDEIPGYQQLLANNQKWVDKRNKMDPNYFKELSKGQSPPYLFIGCSDSRMVVHEMLGCPPGGMFVHRNLANQVSITDMTLLSALSYAIEGLGISHIIVCGHYECGGVKAAVRDDTENSLVANWVNEVKRVYLDHIDELSGIPDTRIRMNRLSELNVEQQVHNLCQTSALRAAFKKGKYPSLHGWIADYSTGLVKDLPMPFEDWIKKGHLPEGYMEFHRHAVTDPLLRQVEA